MRSCSECLYGHFIPSECYKSFSFERKEFKHKTFADDADLMENYKKAAKKKFVIQSGRNEIKIFFNAFEGGNIKFVNKNSNSESSVVKKLPQIT